MEFFQMLLFESDNNVDFNTANTILSKIRTAIGVIRLDELFKDDIKEYIEKSITPGRSDINITDEFKRQFYKCLFMDTSNTPNAVFNIYAFVRNRTLAIFKIGETLYNNVQDLLIDRYGEPIPPDSREKGTSGVSFDDFLNHRGARLDKKINKETHANHDFRNRTTVVRKKSKTSKIQK